MSLDTQEVLKIAQLARLAIHADDIPEYARNLSNILDFIAQMNQADTSTIDPMAHPLAATQRLRPDTVTEIDQHELFQCIAPRVEADLYLVPQVIAEE